MTDYAKFEKLVEEEEDREKKEKEEERLRLRLKYEKEQKEKQRKWDEKLVAEGKDPVAERQKYGGCAFSHLQQMASFGQSHENNSGAHNHGHDGHDHHHHGHDGHGSEHHHGHSAAPKSSCGYMPIEEIKRLTAAKKKETISMEEKNKKKIRAVYAAKEDGNKLFKEQRYETAFKVYERGVLIINGMYQMTEQQEDEMEGVECLLDLNMALVSLKMQNWTEAVNCCRMAIQIDDKNAKAYYRWSEALIGMAEYAQALEQNARAKQLEPKNKSIERQSARIHRLRKQQTDRAKKEDQKIAERIRGNLKK